MSGTNGKPKDEGQAKQAGSSPARDAKGRLLPGHTANPNGRPKGIDFISAIRSHADAEGLDLDLAAYEVSQGLLEKAKAGDTQAAKLWLDRCCGIQKAEVDLNHSGEITNKGPHIPTGDEFGEWFDKLAEIRNGSA